MTLSNSLRAFTILSLLIFLVALTAACTASEPLAESTTFESAAGIEYTKISYAPPSGSDSSESSGEIMSTETENSSLRATTPDETSGGSKIVIIIILGLAVLGLSFVVFSLLRWRQQAKNGGFVVYEEKLLHAIDVANSENIQLHKLLRENIPSLVHDQNFIRESLDSVNNENRKQSEELTRYKAGYDLSRNKAYIKALIGAIKLLDQYASRDYHDLGDEEANLKSTLNYIRAELTETLEDNGIREWVPQLGEIKGSEQNLITPTAPEYPMDESLVGHIASCIHPGWIWDLTSDEVLVIEQAQVKVYVLDKEDTTNV